jgi:hypothetical protein
MMPMGMSRWGFLASCAAVLTDVGKEDKARPTHDARPAKFAPVPRVGRDEGMPVGGIDGPNGADDEEEHDRELDENDDVVEAGRFLDPDDQHRGDKSDDEDGGEVENRGDVRQGARVGPERLDLVRQTRVQGDPSNLHFQGSRQRGGDLHEFDAAGGRELRGNVYPKVSQERNHVA